MRGKCESCEFFEAMGNEETDWQPFTSSCHIRSVEGDWPRRFDWEWCGEHREREEQPGEELEACMNMINSRLGEGTEEPPVTTEVHHCICGEAVDIKVQGGRVIDWNGHGKCPGPVQILG